MRFLDFFTNRDLEERLQREKEHAEREKEHAERIELELERSRRRQEEERQKNDFFFKTLIVILIVSLIALLFLLNTPKMQPDPPKVRSSFSDAQTKPSSMTPSPSEKAPAFASSSSSDEPTKPSSTTPPPSSQKKKKKRRKKNQETAVSTEAQNSELPVDFSKEYDIVDGDFVFVCKNSRHSEKRSRFFPTNIPKTVVILCVSDDPGKCVSRKFEGPKPEESVKYHTSYYSWLTENKAAIGYYYSQSRQDALRSSAGLEDFKKLRIFQLLAKNITEIDPFAFVNLGELEELDLAGNRIEALRNNTFVGLNNLRYLNLEGNFLSAIQTGVFEQLPNITYLNLDRNKLKISHWRWFGRLQHLQVLKMNENRIDKWKGLSEASPTQVRGDHTRLIGSQIPETGTMMMTLGEVFSTSKLRVIEMSNNNLTSVDMKLFERAPMLEHLDFSNNTIKTINRKAFDRLTNLRILILRNNGLSTLYVEWFSALVRNSEETDEEEVIVDLSGNEWNCNCDILEYSKFLRKLGDSELNIKLLTTLHVKCSAPIALEGHTIDGGASVHGAMASCNESASRGTETTSTNPDLKSDPGAAKNRQSTNKSTAEVSSKTEQADNSADTVVYGALYTAVIIFAIFREVQRRNKIEGHIPRFDPQIEAEQDQYDDIYHDAPDAAQPEQHPPRGRRDGVVHRVHVHNDQVAASRDGSLQQPQEQRAVMSQLNIKVEDVNNQDLTRDQDPSPDSPTNERTPIQASHGDTTQMEYESRNRISSVDQNLPVRQPSQHISTAAGLVKKAFLEPKVVGPDGVEFQNTSDGAKESDKTQSNKNLDEMSSQ